MVKPASGGFGEQWVLRSLPRAERSFARFIYPGYLSKRRNKAAIVSGTSRRLLPVGSLTGLCRPDSDPSVVFALGPRPLEVRDPVSCRKDRLRHSQGAGLVGPDGGLLCSFPVRGSVSAIVWENQSVIICHGSPAQPLVTVLSEAGQVIWEHPVPSPAHSLIYGESIVVALCQTHVVGFSLRDGHREFSFTTRDLPLALGDGLVLLGKDSGACLVDLDTNLTRLP